MAYVKNNNTRTDWGFVRSMSARLHNAKATEAPQSIASSHGNANTSTEWYWGNRMVARVIMMWQWREGRITKENGGESNNDVAVAGRQNYEKKWRKE